MSSTRISHGSTPTNLGGIGRRPSKRRRRAGIGRVALIAFVMLMLVLPLTGGRAFAADDELIILDDTIETAPVDDAIDDTVLDEDETPPAELDQVDDPILDDPVLDPGDPGGPSDLYLNATLCPGDLDLWSVDYYGLAAACQGGHANGWEVFVSDINGTPFWQQVVADSYLAVSGLPANDYLVQVNDPAAGPVTMRVMCAADDLLGNDAIGPFEAPVASQVASIAIQGDLMYWCDVFIVDIGDQTGGTGEAGEVTFTINKHVCPENIVSDDPYFLASVCHGQLSDVDFSFDDGLGNVGTATTDAMSLATYGPVATGAWTITESIPGGYGDPQVFCGFDDFLGNDIGGFEHPDLTGGSFTLDVPADAAYAFCDVMNHPLDSEGGSIKIFKYTCPDGFDPSTTEVYGNCGGTVDGVQFNATGPGGYAAQTDTGDSISGAVSFGGLEAGDYEVVETVPDGYAAHVVSCTSDTKMFVQQHEEDLTDAPSLAWSLDDNEDIVCSWYNVPTHHDDSVDVFITKWGCPEGFSSDDPSELSAECDEEMEGIDFTAEHIASGTTATDDTGGQPARAAFTPWYTGDSTFTEDIPIGYGEPTVYCSVEDDFGTVVPGFEYAEYAATGGTIEVTIPTPPADDLYTVFCDWYNVPHHEQDGHVTISKWECPEGTTDGENLAYYLTECTEAMVGVEFEQGPHSGSKQTVATDASGEVSFPVDELADWSIEEIVPSGYSENPIAFCRWGGYLSNEFDDTLLALDGFANLGPNGGTTLRFDTYEQFGMACNWFNLPDKTTDNGSLTITKYWCEGYVVNVETCELGSGVKFAVSPVNVATEGFFVETGPSGSVTLDFPAWTALAVEEADFEWCKAVASKVDAAGNVVIEANAETTLTVYNCNADTGTKNPPVKTFPNTGSGAMASAAVDAPASGGLSAELLTMTGGLLQLGLVVAGRTLGHSPAGMLGAVLNR